MIFLKLFENSTYYEAFTATTEFIKPNTSFCEEEKEMHYAPIPHDYSKDYLTFVARADGTFKLSGNSVNYSLDNGTTWTSLASNTSSPTVRAGKKIMWKATITPTASYAKGVGRFISTADFDVEGNPMSLSYGDDFEKQTTLKGNYAFSNLFVGNTNIISAENLVLPATAATNYSYYGMFSGCTKLENAPEIHLRTLVDSCCHSMFKGCTSLTKAPELLAYTIQTYSYNSMFSGCTSLNYVKCMAGSLYNSNGLINWLSGVSSTGTFVKLQYTSFWSSGVSGIPSNWTVIEENSSD